MSWNRCLLPAGRIVREVFAAAHGVMQRRHVGVDVFVEHVLGDRGLRQHPFAARDLLAREDLLGGDDRGTPLIVRVGRGDTLEADRLPFLEEVLLVFVAIFLAVLAVTIGLRMVLPKHVTRIASIAIALAGTISATGLMIYGFRLASENFATDAGASAYVYGGIGVGILIVSRILATILRA